MLVSGAGAKDFDLIVEEKLLGWEQFETMSEDFVLTLGNSGTVMVFNVRLVLGPEQNVKSRIDRILNWRKPDDIGNTIGKMEESLLLYYRRTQGL